MKRTPQTILSLTAIAMVIAFFTTSVLAGAPPSKAGKSTFVYFVRHGEDTEELVGLEDPSFSILYNDCVQWDDDGELADCCVEALNQQGRTRAALLANWLQMLGITDKLTHVIASHKIRTQQTVQPIALAAGLGGDLDGDGILDGADVDLVPGDGVINVPDVAECEPGFEKAKSVIDPQVAYISTLPVGSRAVVCSHSPALYPIMDAFGIDTSDPVKFPRKSNGKVDGFNNLWVVELTPVATGEGCVYQGRLLVHYVLDLQVGVTAFHLDTPAPPMGGE